MDTRQPAMRSRDCPLFSRTKLQSKLLAEPLWHPLRRQRTIPMRRMDPRTSAGQNPVCH